MGDFIKVFFEKSSIMTRNRNGISGKENRMKDLRTSSGTWCRVPGGKAEYSLFRRHFRLKETAELRLLVSADSRYNLYLDGKLLGRGPVRGDLEHYHYEQYELEIPSGDHLLCAEVLFWNDGLRLPWSEVHFSPAFLLLGECGGLELSTPDHWRCLADPSRSALLWCDAWERKHVIPIAPMEAFTAGTETEHWNRPGFDDSRWIFPESIARPCFPELCRSDPPSRWKLRESGVPQMRSEAIRISSVLSGGGENLLISSEGTFKGSLPAGTHTVLLDLGQYYTHVFRFNASGGRGSVRIAYGEALFENGKKCADRGPVPGAGIGKNGYGDRIRLAGGETEFHPFWYRSGRYVELEFELSEPLSLELSFAFLAYPLKRRVDFQAPEDPVLVRIFETAWHTARCCAHEHYEDCPYWEQMQYVGDTRIQALISYIGSGDGRLGRQAIRQFDESRIGSGLTMSRYPSNFRQIIPGFSLFWIMMIDDYHSFFQDAEVICEHWNGIRDVLDFFENHREESGLIGPVGGWNFCDWVPGWPEGKSDRGEKLPETLLNLLYAECCRLAESFSVLAGADERGYGARRKRVLDAVNRLCYSEREHLYTDVPGRAWYSQHVNAWAVLAGAAEGKKAEKLADAVMNDSRLSPCSLYFSFYLLELMRRLDRRGDFRRLLKRWETILERGYTTFPECPWPETRSDCHAWSAGPFYHLLKYQLQRNEGEQK